MRSRPVRSGGGCPGRFLSAGYTLVEVLIATTLALMLMAAVAQMFAQLGTSVNNSRATLETADRLRACQLRLQMDIEGLTVTMLPPRRVENEEGYGEYREGGAPGSANCPSPTPVNSLTGSSDSSFATTTVTGGTVAGTVGETGDILMFTSRNSNRPFSGQYNGATIQSETAEIAWFMRGHNLYRRVLLVVPGLNVNGVLPSANVAGFYASNDISVHLSGGTSGSLVANTLGDLTRRECRFAHNPNLAAFPYSCYWGALGLPTLRDVGTSTFDPGGTPSPQGAGQVDYWSQSHPFQGINGLDPVNGPVTGGAAGGTCTRTDDLILTNVIGFDVKAWDPGAGAYVDLGAPAPTPGNVSPSPQASTFAWGSGPYQTNQTLSGLTANNGLPTYDTWSTSYENLGTGGVNPGQGDTPCQGTNGFDVSGKGVVDGPADAITSAPFPVPLRGIQIKIRVFEPDSHNIREVTVTQDFLPK
ncbi:MAG: type II secretion system protein J [Thermoguttaceae bacterium]